MILFIIFLILSIFTQLYSLSLWRISVSWFILCCLFFTCWLVDYAALYEVNDDDNKCIFLVVWDALQALRSTQLRMLQGALPAAASIPRWSFCRWCNWLWSPYFLLLARYVPNVAKRSIWDQCKKKYILRTNWQTDRPTSHLAHIRAISPRGVVRSTSCLVLRWGFRGRRIEWRYFWFRHTIHMTKFSRYVGENNARGVIRLVTI